MKESVLPIPVSAPNLYETAPRLLDEEKEADREKTETKAETYPVFYCVWLSDDSRRAFATDGFDEVEIDYRRHVEWSKQALGEFSEEYIDRLPVLSDESLSEPGVDRLDGLMHSVCLNLRDEPGHRSWSYLFNRRDGRSYVSIKWRAVEFCRQENRRCRADSDGGGDGDSDGGQDEEVATEGREAGYTDPYVVRNITSMER